MLENQISVWQPPIPKWRYGYHTQSSLVRFTEQTLCLVDWPDLHTLECRYNAMQYNTINVHPRQSIDQGLHTLKKPHISPSRASYGVSIVNILEKTDRFITVPHCIYQPAFHANEPV